jgi:hypothetical protein
MKHYGILLAVAIVGSAYNHLKLGLGVTRGAEVEAVDYSGNPLVYYSYSPLASYLLAIPSAAGAPFPASVRLLTFLLFLWFLLAFGCRRRERPDFETCPLRGGGEMRLV